MSLHNYPFCFQPVVFQPTVFTHAPIVHGLWGRNPLLMAENGTSVATDGMAFIVNPASAGGKVGNLASILGLRLEQSGTDSMTRPCVSAASQSCSDSEFVVFCVLQTGQRWGSVHDKIKALMKKRQGGGSFKVLMTKVPHEATELAREALKVRIALVRIALPRPKLVLMIDDSTSTVQAANLKPMQKFGFEEWCCRHRNLVCICFTGRANTLLPNFSGLLFLCIL